MTLGTIYVVFAAHNFVGQFEGFLITLGVPIAAWCGVMLADIALRRRDYAEPELFTTAGRYGDIRWAPGRWPWCRPGIGWGLVTNTSASWLTWQGYLLSPFGLGGKTGAWAYANLGVLIALAIGFVAHRVFGRSAGAGRGGGTGANPRDRLTRLALHLPGICRLLWPYGDAGDRPSRQGPVRFPQLPEPAGGSQHGHTAAQAPPTVAAGDAVAADGRHDRGSGPHRRVRQGDLQGANGGPACRADRDRAPHAARGPPPRPRLPPPRSGRSPTVLRGCPTGSFPPPGGEAARARWQLRCSAGRRASTPWPGASTSAER
jgi:hypothetical protein